MSKEEQDQANKILTDITKIEDYKNLSSCAIGAFQALLLQAKMGHITDNIVIYAEHIANNLQDTYYKITKRHDLMDILFQELMQEPYEDMNYDND